MNETTGTATTAAPDRAAIRIELEATQAAFRELVGQIDDAKWNAKSGNPAWTNGQLAWHIASGVKFASGIIDKARQGKATNPPSFIMPLALKANEMLVRRSSRKANRASVIADFDANMAALRGTLDALRDDEFAIRKTNFGMTRTIAEAFNLVAEHFGEHAPEIRQGLAGGAGTTPMP